MTGGEEFDITVRGHHLHGQRFGSSESPLVIGVHGLTGNMKSFDFLGDQFGASGLQLATFDLRGRGRSEVTAPGTYGWRNHALDVFALADALGFQRFSLIGQSMGGSIAIKAAEMDAARLDSLVLVDVAGRVEPGVGPVIASVIDRIDVVHRTIDDYVDAERNQAMVAPWNEYWDAFYRYQAKVVDGGVRSRANREAVLEDRAFGAVQDPYDRWRCLTIPTLLLRATRELVPGAGRVVPEEDRTRFEAEVPGSVTVEIDANHVTINTHPQAAEAIARFLAAVLDER